MTGITQAVPETMLRVAPQRDGVKSLSRELEKGEGKAEANGGMNTRRPVTTTASTPPGGAYFSSLGLPRASPSVLLKPTLRQRPPERPAGAVSNPGGTLKNATLASRP